MRVDINFVHFILILQIIDNVLSGNICKYFIAYSLVIIGLISRINQLLNYI